MTIDQAKEILEITKATITSDEDSVGNVVVDLVCTAIDTIIDAVDAHDIDMCDVDVDSNIDKRDDMFSFLDGIAYGLNNPLQEPLEWTLCEEILPKVAKRVLLALPDRVVIGSYHSNGRFRFECDDFNHTYTNEEVVAWMPLPNNYERRDVNESETQ